MLGCNMYEDLLSRGLFQRRSEGRSIRFTVQDKTSELTSTLRLEVRLCISTRRHRSDGPLTNCNTRKSITSSELSQRKHVNGVTPPLTNSLHMCHEGSRHYGQDMFACDATSYRPWPNTTPALDLTKCVKQYHIKSIRMFESSEQMT